MNFNQRPSYANWSIRRKKMAGFNIVSKYYKTGSIKKLQTKINH